MKRRISDHLNDGRIEPQPAAPRGAARGNPRPKGVPLSLEFDTYLDEDGHRCWKWWTHASSIPPTYVGGQHARMALYEAVVGPVPRGKRLTPTLECMSENCVAPEHMELLDPAKAVDRYAKITDNYAWLGENESYVYLRGED